MGSSALPHAATGAADLASTAPIGNVLPMLEFPSDGPRHGRRHVSRVSVEHLVWITRKDQSPLTARLPGATIERRARRPDRVLRLRQGGRRREPGILHIRVGEDLCCERIPNRPGERCWVKRKNPGWSR